MSDIRIGQVWRDGDPREKNRTVKVIDVVAGRRFGHSDRFAICVHAQRPEGKRTRIRVDRMKPPRWVLVMDVSRW